MMLVVIKNNLGSAKNGFFLGAPDIQWKESINVIKNIAFDQIRKCYNTFTS